MTLSKRDILKTVFIASALLFMILYAWRAVQRVGQLPASPELAPLLASLIINWLGFVSVIIIWKLLIKSYGDVITVGQAYRIYFRSNLGKYLPGKVWQLAGMVFLCNEIGIGPKKSLPASLYNQSAAVITGLGIFLTTLPTDATGLTRSPVWYVLLAVALSLLILSPDFLTGMMNRALRILGKDEIRESIGRRVLLVALIVYVPAWCVFGWGFHVFLRFLGLSNALTLFRAVGIFSGSVSIGFLAFFSPGGIGVREGMMVFLLQEYYPLTTAVFISITARLWITAVELIGFLSPYLFPVRPSAGATGP